jgi:hypothetical protein
MTMIAGSALLGMSTAFNAMSLHGTCTAVFVAVSAVMTFFPASLRTLGSVKWIGWVGLLSMVVSILLVVGAVGSGNRPSGAPLDFPAGKELVLWGHPSFSDAVCLRSLLVLPFVVPPFPLSPLSSFRLLSSLSSSFFLLIHSSSH